VTCINGSSICQSKKLWWWSIRAVNDQFQQLFGGWLLLAMVHCGSLDDIPIMQHADK